MKRILVVGVVVMAALGAAPSHAAKESVSATIVGPVAVLLPNPAPEPVGQGPTWFRDNCVDPVLEGRDPLETCEKQPYFAHARCAYLAAQEVDPTLAQDGSGGKIGYVIDVKNSWKGNDFTLENVQDDQATADFDVNFYITLGSVEGCASTQAGPGATVNPRVKTRYSRLGNEAGTIPEDTEYAVVVCQCVQAKFRFEVTGI